MPSIRAVATRHPQVVDGVLAAVLAGVSVPVTGVNGSTAGLNWLWFAALHVPLVWRRRAPLIVFATVVVLVFASVAADANGPSLMIVPMAAIYTVARHRARQIAWTAFGALTGPLAVGWLLGGGEWWDVVTLIALFAASVLLGTNIQTRRAYLAELVDRAARLERERDQQARLAVAAERARIAREMHDIVAHNLAVMVALADGAAAATPDAPHHAVEMMEQTSSTGREALGEIRRLVGLLREGDDVPMEHAARIAPAPQPGLDDVDDLVEQVRAAGLEVALTREGEPGAWGRGAGLAVYRIVQEALTNTMKHAGPQARADVRLRYTGTGVELDVLDDGGRRPVRLGGDAPQGGHGLAGMAERAASYGGHVEAGPRTGSGWRVHARLPFGDSEVA